MARGLSFLLLLLVIGAGWEAWQAFVEPSTTRQPADPREALWDPEATGTARIRAVEAWVAMGSAAVPQLVPGLQHSHAEVRRSTALALGWLGEDAIVAIPELTTSLKDEDGRVREISAFALSEMLRFQVPADAQAAMAPPLLALLSDTDFTRNAAVRALLRLDDAALAPLLYPAVQRDEIPRYRIVDLLAQRTRPLPGAVPALVHVLSDENGEARRGALRVLLSWESCTGEQTLSFVSSESVEDRIAGLETLLKLPEVPVDVLPYLPAVIRSVEYREQFSALQVAGRLGPSARELSPVLADVFTTLSDSIVPGRPWGTESSRREALRTLDLIDCEEEMLLPVVRKGLDDPTSTVVDAAAEILARRWPEEARRLVPQLINRVRTADEPGDFRAASTLGGFGPLAHEAEPVLLQTLEVQHTPNRHWPVLSALTRIRPSGESAVPILETFILRALADRDRRSEATLAVGVLEAMGPRGSASTPLLARIIQSGQPSVFGKSEIPIADNFGQWLRMAAVRALACYAPTTPAAHKALETAFLDDSDQVRAEALRALVPLAESDQVRHALLDGASRDPSTAVRSAAAELMADDSEHADVWVPQLIDMLKDQDRNDAVRMAAAGALEKFGPHARGAIEALERAMSLAASPREYLRMQAALRGIEGKR